jgi:NAD(P)-dependent dehydrogenase (short-subunit alcohol dehydrogenase family)
MSRLEGKVAVVTGGCSGIGRATVERFVEEGARVVVGDVQKEKGAELPEALGDRVTYVHTDVAREADVKGLIGLAASRFGRLDCLFNNAGFPGVAGEIHELDMGEPYERSIGVLLNGVVAGMKHAAPIMRAQRSGSIISTASVAGLTAGYGAHVYSALKAAVINLTRSVAAELGPYNVRVNAICPGGIATPIHLHALEAPPEQADSLLEKIRPVLAAAQPLPRNGEPADIANAALFLASDESSFVSGQALVVDGALLVGSGRRALEASVSSAMAEQGLEAPLPGARPA